MITYTLISIYIDQEAHDIDLYIYAKYKFV